MTLEILTKHTGRVEEALDVALDGTSPLRLILRYHVGLANERGEPSSLRGKLLRPGLLLFTADQLGADVDRALPAAVGLELIHAFSLIHDDIQDGDRTRRGRAAAWTVWGVSQAINAGDLMHAVAVRACLQAGRDVTQVLLDATVRMIEGQSMDLRFETEHASATEYVDMVDRKTGALITAALEMAGVLGGVAPSGMDRLRRLGRSIGRAFQMQDDLLGVWGDSDRLGKPAGSDIRRRKKAFPAMLALERATGDDLAQLNAVYRGQSPLTDGEIAHVVELMAKYGIRQAVQDAVQEELEHACAALNELPFSSEGRHEMQAFLEHLGRRDR